MFDAAGNRRHIYPGLSYFWPTLESYILWMLDDELFYQVAKSENYARNIGGLLLAFQNV